MGRVNNLFLMFFSIEPKKIYSFFSCLARYMDIQCCNIPDVNLPDVTKYDCDGITI